MSSARRRSSLPLQAASLIGSMLAGIPPGGAGFAGELQQRVNRKTALVAESGLG